MAEQDVPTSSPLGRRELLAATGLLLLAVLAVAAAGSFLGQADLTWAIWRMRLFRLAAAAVSRPLPSSGSGRLDAVLEFL